MRMLAFALPAATLLALLTATAAKAAEERQLLESINAYRSQVQRCAGQASAELPPLAEDSRLTLAAGRAADLQPALAAVGYPLVNVKAITLSGPRDAAAAMAAVRDSFCQVVLDPQFVDIGIHRDGRDWRVLLARPLLAARLGTWESEGRLLLDHVNSARAEARTCGTQRQAAAAPLAWNGSLATAAQGHSQAMANRNFFDHKDPDGRTPGDRAELAGYSAQQIGENIAAGQDSARKVVDGWLASPGHCANLMNPGFRELGAAYAHDPKSDAGIYWTAMFGTPMN